MLSVKKLKQETSKVLTILDIKPKRFEIHLAYNGDLILTGYGHMPIIGRIIKGNWELELPETAKLYQVI